MSYDLMVFEPASAPPKHHDFLAWYNIQTKWTEGHSYNDPTVASRRLRDWFAEIIQIFPPLNGPLSKEELPEDEATATDYSIGKIIIYASFAWSKEGDAYEAVFALAQKHSLGFFNVSSNDEEVWLPNKERLVLAHRKEPPSLLTKAKERFRLNSKPN